jgi:hypothetical protein
MLPHPLTGARASRPAVLLVAAAVAGCNPHHGPLEGRASDEWTRRYTIEAGGELQIVGGHGSIDVQSGSGPAVEVRAERIIHAATDAAAAPLVSQIQIREDVAPAKVVLQDEGLSGIILGIQVEVNFHVTVPAGVRVRLRSTDGAITLQNLDGPVVASAITGSIEGKNLRGGVDARSTNGKVSIDLAAIGDDPVDLRSTNGSVTLTLPATADANVQATCTNGKIEVADLALEPLGEQTRRRTRGRLNKGGTPIDLSTTNGDIHIRPRS